MHLQLGASNFFLISLTRRSEALHPEIYGRQRNLCILTNRVMLGFFYGARHYPSALPFGALGHSASLLNLKTVDIGSNHGRRGCIFLSLSHLI